jgi:hypothetical protein
MHQLLVAFFAFIFSFGHAQSVQQAQADAFVPPAQYADGFEGAIPSRQEIAAGEYNATTDSYAESACSGCQVIPVSFNAR